MPPLEENDPLRIGIPVTVEVLPFEKPTKFISVNDEVIRSVSMYMTPVIYHASPNREVPVERILINAKTLFRVGRNYDDKEFWVQHCASSLREIISFVEPGHFKSAHQNIPDKSDPRVEKHFNFIARANNYLSSIVHCRPSQRMGDAEQLYPGQGYGQLTKEEFLKQESDFFERVTIDLVYTLHHLFVTFCSGNNQQ